MRLFLEKPCEKTGNDTKQAEPSTILDRKDLGKIMLAYRVTCLMVTDPHGDGAKLLTVSIDFE